MLSAHDSWCPVLPLIPNVSGKQLFEFMEDFMKKRGYSSFVYYADHPAAIAICRKRGYKEAFMKKEKMHVFYLSLKQKEEENEN